MSSAGQRLPDEDRASLGISFGVSPANVIPVSAITESLLDEYDPRALGAVEMGYFLETVTIPSTLGSNAAIQDQPVWIVKLSGLSIEQHGPQSLDGTDLPTHTLHRAYIFFDADSAEFLFTVWQE